MWTKGDIVGMYDALIASSLAQLHLEFDAEQLEQLNSYIAEIELWNPVYKLVGASGEELITKHIIDSLSAVDHIKGLLQDYEHPVLADLGSGAGLPGIPLAIALKGYSFTLVERMGRRVGFLNNALARCGLGDRVTVYDKDLSQVKGTFDLITFRAFHPLYDILDQVAPILSPQGVVCAYKGQMDSLVKELEQVRTSCKSSWVEKTENLVVPYLDAQRLLCILKKK